MVVEKRLLPVFVAFIFCCASPVVKAQRFLADYDSTLFLNDTLRPLVKRFQNLAISGYIQPQFQVAQKEGVATFEGGNFSANAGNRFQLRRARIKIDYVLPAAASRYPKALFTFQVDATERGVIVRDMFLRLYEPKRQNLSLAMGLFARPFGYEVNLASSYRETPERGRMSQTLLPGERDLGGMLSYETHTGLHTKPLLKFDLGVFNGTGPTGATDFDSYKDLISRLTLKEWKPAEKILLSGGLSAFTGGWRQDTKYKYEASTVNGLKVFALDSSLSNLGAKAARQYIGADVQLVLMHNRGKTEWRAEYWRGRQPGTAVTTVSPASQPAGPTYLRKFDGAFFLLSAKHRQPRLGTAGKVRLVRPKHGGKGRRHRQGGSKPYRCRYKIQHIGHRPYPLLRRQLKSFGVLRFCTQRRHTAGRLCRRCAGRCVYAATAIAVLRPLFYVDGFDNDFFMHGMRR